MHERRFPAAQAQRLEDPSRPTWLPPAEILTATGVRAGEVVADIGAGTGYFAAPIAQIVGAAGAVYAVDAQPEMLEWIQKKIEASGLKNIQLVHADAVATTLPDAACDLYFIANVWHELDDRQVVLREARRILKAAGRIAILDWRPDVERVNGPPLEHRLSTATAADDLRQAGFHGLTMRNVGQFSWLVMAER